MKRTALIVALLVALPVLAGERAKKPKKPLTYQEQVEDSRAAIAAKNLKQRKTRDLKAERDFDRRMEAARKPRVDRWNPLGSGPQSMTAGT